MASIVTEVLAGRGLPDRGQQRAFVLSIEGGPTRRFAEPVVVLGSSSRCDFVIDDTGVSRQHARIEVRADAIAIQDLGSTNGTRVDGVRIATAFLGERATIEVGHTRVAFTLTEDTETFAIHPTTAFGRLRGRGVAMRRLFAQLEKVAATDATVLLRGESGTGKELIAEALHARGRRAQAPFVVVDCAALPASLIEAELFGYEKGAFTGAVQARAGAFEVAGGGTVFLDEIGELERALQPRLLRALEARTFKRLGAAQHQKCDVRVIAATNRDLAAMVTAGEFREDLYHRLAVVEVRVPPLREHLEDLELLAEVFAAEICDREPTARRDRLDARALAALAARRWTGNVRELRNHIERLLLLGELDEAAEDTAPAATDAAVAAVAAAIDAAPYALARQQALDRFERDYVAAALARSGGNVAQAARDCKVERSYLFKLIRRHGLRGE